jgi:Uma2 family endonuclease
VTVKAWPLERKRGKKKPGMTLQEYFATPETNLPRQLVDGVLHVRDAPFVSHQRAVFSLGRALHAHVAESGSGEVFLAPIDVILDPDRPLVVQPDALFVSQERSSIVRERVYGAPDLVIEVLSPHPRVGELAERVRWFAHYGVREIWLYRQPERRLNIHYCEAGQMIRTESFSRFAPIESSVLPAFGGTVNSMFDLY